MKPTPAVMSDMPGRGSLFKIFFELHLTYLNSEGLRGLPVCINQTFYESPFLECMVG
jgi:hypothetical protein